jgi:hypothetical protein
MQLPGRAMGAFSRHRMLATFAALLSTWMLAAGLSAAPASAATSAPAFTPYYFGKFLLQDYNTGYCLRDEGTYASPTQCNASDPSQQWRMYTSPYANGLNFASLAPNYLGQTTCLDYGAHVNPCDWNNTWQSWVEGRGAPGANNAYTLDDYQSQVSGDDQCLDSSTFGAPAYVNPCNWNDLYQNWYIVYVGQ